MKSIKYISAAVVLSLTLVSCGDEFLDKDPDERIEIKTIGQVQQLLTSAKRSIPAKYYQPEGLKRLYTHDAASSVSYADTLKTYLDNNMSISATAKALYIHRSSLIDRLDHINRLLGSDLEDPLERLKLQFIMHMSETDG